MGVIEISLLKKNNGNLNIQQKDNNNLRKLIYLNNNALNAFKNLLSKSSNENENIPVIFAYLPRYIELENVDADLLLPMKLLKKKVEKSKA